jgi:radical SAM protein (TIGR01212 family)
VKYISIGEVWKEKYKEKVYKISLSAATTCPNRDGVKGYGGCTFCSRAGSGDFALCLGRDIDRAIEKGKVYSRRKGAKKFVAYFQSFTGTYGDLSRLNKIYTAVAQRRDIREIYIATRCDCLGEKEMEMLENLNKIKPLTVELGLQSSNKETLKKINCGYTAEDFTRGVKKLTRRGIPVVAHIILGFPWENSTDMAKSAKFATDRGAQGVKLQLLHILKGTKMGDEYEKSPFKTLSLEEYLQCISACLYAMDKNVIIHRLTGDGAKKDLLAPLWSADKKRVLNAVKKYIESLPENGE